MSSAKKHHGDGTTTIEELKTIVEVFVAQRDWAQFHSPKNLAMAIGVEAGELMDLFRWHSESASIQAFKNLKYRKAATEELADVMICALAFANRTGIDLADAVHHKVMKNSKNYPIKRYKGRY